MATNDQANDVATYAASVRAALSDLPVDQAEVLLEDLDDHLREVAVEAGGSLAERLGPPGQYAQELRTAYGATESTTRWPDPALQDLRRAVAWARESALYREVRAFLPQLRSAWWVLRAYLAVLILTAALSPGYNLGPLPSPITKRGLAEILATGVAIWLSIRIGRRQRLLPQPARVVAASVNVLIAFVALVILENMGSFPSSAMFRGAYPEQSTFGTAFAAGPVSNIYAYSQDGKPLTNVLLYDQDGRPLTVQKSDVQTSYPIGADGRLITNAYPLTQRHINGEPVAAPRVMVPAWPSPSPTATPTPSPSPSPTPGATH